ncbi:MAG: FAD-dependent oxidoreductase [Gammaproteobacteria bacterium]
MNGRVLIAGGGPSGMATALFLIQRGIPVAIIERSVEPHADPRAATYHPPTLEMLAPSGVTDELHAKGIIARRWQFRDRREGLIAEFDLGLLAEDTPFPYRLQCEQHKLVAMMERRVVSSSLATVVHGADIENVMQDSSGVRIEMRHANGTQSQLLGGFLVGADGGRSVVRKSQGIEFEGFTWPERFVVITTTFDFEQLGFAYSSYTMDPIEWAATFKVPGDDQRGIWRCVFPAKADEIESELLDPARAALRLARFVPESRSASVVHVNLYAVHQRVAATYRKGRVLLAGDAAHINNPLGGMGLNFGIHDAHRLAECLAETFETGGDAPLDRYDRQRRAVAERYLQAQTIANKQTLEETDPDRRLARQMEMRAIAADPDRARQYLLQTAMIEGLRVAASIA